ncbi:hypothetical protein EAF00_009542 [Botryotinia globosa]|nr:hypothetical protein EAF00_009542 [Botryotinia globosa]
MIIVDFAYSCPEKGKTYARCQQKANSDALYLHFDRPRMTVTELHDIYALKVLLEIATWNTARDHFDYVAKGPDLYVTTIDKAEVRKFSK